MNKQLWWYIARSEGIVSWALLAGSVLLTSPDAKSKSAQQRSVL